ncbi:hypothetical protein DICVIV_11953 [Dictyocaulus viviparus]|uniref:Uncharacterized protein n=1 Tax=Dictyocaulus viviparus TaxID=29172 RepID=A0A0D8XBU8_DICVI|nr:hypothetical protein DICVIV_11953 [Dictyocaulus viviparus]
MAHEVVVTKTLYDPSNTLSKNATKRWLASGLDNFHLNVPYSLNKQKRWQNVLRNDSNDTTNIKDDQSQAVKNELLEENHELSELEVFVTQNILYVLGVSAIGVVHVIANHTGQCIVSNSRNEVSNGINNVPSNSARGALCPTKKCNARYDKSGLVEYCRNILMPYHPRWRKNHLKDERPKYENPAKVELVEPLRLIKKEFTVVCTEARNYRFDKMKWRQIEKSPTLNSLSFNERSTIIDMMKTILLLVESSMAWLYFKRSEKSVRQLKLVVLRIFQHYLSMYRCITESKINDDDYHQHMNASRELVEHAVKFIQNIKASRCFEQ